MRSVKKTLFGLCVCCCVLQIACERQSAEDKTATDDAIAQDGQTPETSGIIPASSEELVTTRKAIVGANEIPYPVYPNGSRYRVGGENGLKIVLYQTHDSFEEVDQFYKSRAQEVGMPRLAGMNDYVRYATSGDDQDPWETAKPGIVIHRFKDDYERNAVGANQAALTNIIMSF